MGGRELLVRRGDRGTTPRGTQDVGDEDGELVAQRVHREHGDGPRSAPLERCRPVREVLQDRAHPVGRRAPVVAGALQAGRPQRDAPVEEPSQLALEVLDRSVGRRGEDQSSPRRMASRRSISM